MDDSEARGGPLESQDGREPSDEPVISTEELTKRFGREEAVQDLSFEVPRGTIFGFIGPSGSGKTTTIRLLTGFYKPTSGTASVLGERPSHFSRTQRSRIGYMPQHFVLYPHLTAWQNLNFAASIYGVELRRSARLRELMDFVELTEHRSKVTHALSGGMRRRLTLAATLVHDPELLFLDEPTAGIDPLLRDKFWEYFRSLQQEGRTLFVTTQYVSEAAYCDLVALLVDGRLIALDTPQELRRRAFGGEALDVGTIEPLDAGTLDLLNDFSFVRRVSRQDDTRVRIIVSEASTALPALVEWYQRQDAEIEFIEEYAPPFDAVFVELVRQGSTK